MGETAKRIAVLGAGLIGNYVGGRLAAGGADVVLIGRGRVLGDLRTHGLHLTDLEGGDRRIAADKLNLAEDPAALGQADLILLCVKSQGTEDAAGQIAQFARPGTAVVSLQNGVSNADRLRAALPGRTVLAGMVPYNVAQPGPGHYHQGTSGVILIEDSPAIAPYVPLFAAAQLALGLRADMVAVLWGKLLINLNNAINALAGVPLAAQIAQRNYRRSVALCQFEALSLLKRAGIKPAQFAAVPMWLLPHVFSLPDGLFRRVAARGGMPRIDRHARSSMAEDLAAGRKTEIDYINGEILALARRLGRKAPVNARVIDLIHKAEAGASPWSADALHAELKKARRG
jgi:2-dehydropantoate 2-reductase